MSKFKFKIKDNVKLKQLEKFGFQHWQIGFDGWYYKDIDKGSIDEIVIYDQVDSFEVKRFGICERYILFYKELGLKSAFMKKKYIKDLIKAGLVEKVEG